MGKTLKTTCKMCRREGVSLCGKEKCALKRRPTTPGVHGPTSQRARLSTYALQLREKQKAKRLYLIMERQFRNYFAHATKMKGDTGHLLIRLLETRLDNVLYRLGFATTRRQARQMVGHGFVDVNGKKVDIPSFHVRVGDVIKIRESKKKKGLINGLAERVQQKDTLSWLTVDAESLSGKVTGIPEGEDLKTVFDPKLIVEFYSRT
ncbi:MAG: 30S ribosomal protein S4 [Patescibacteria group bacterium]